MSGGCVLVLNCGSSSVKLALVDPVSGDRRLTGLAERVGSDDAVVRLRRGDDEQRSAPDDTSARGALAHLLGELTDGERGGLVGVGHRVVHGGDRFSASVAVDDATLAELHGLTDLAPLHMPANLLGIEAEPRPEAAGDGQPLTPCEHCPCFALVQRFGGDRVHPALHYLHGRNVAQDAQHGEIPCRTCFVYRRGD